MADNYLERRMEEYRQGQLNKPSIRRTPSGSKPGTISIKFPPRRVFVTGGASGIGREIVKTFRQADHLQHPSQRVGKPADIARMCLFLAAPDNDFINGENIIIDGGMTRKMIYLD